MSRHGSSMRSKRLQRVKRALIDAGRKGLTSIQVIQRCEVCSPRDAVFDLRANGIRIGAMWERNGRGGAHKRYWIVPFQPPCAEVLPPFEAKETQEAAA